MIVFYSYAEYSPETSNQKPNVRYNPFFKRCKSKVLTKLSQIHPCIWCDFYTLSHISKLSLEFLVRFISSAD